MRSALSIIAVTVVLAGCGETTGDSATSQAPEKDEVCGVNGYGNKLCNEEAAAYCELIGYPFESDADTTDFCEEVELAGY